MRHLIRTALPGAIGGTLRSNLLMASEEAAKDTAAQPKELLAGGGVAPGVATAKVTASACVEGRGTAAIGGTKASVLAQGAMENTPMPGAPPPPPPPPPPPGELKPPPPASPPKALMVQLKTPQVPLLLEAAASIGGFTNDWGGGAAAAEKKRAAPSTVTPAPAQKRAKGEEDPASPSGAPSGKRCEHGRQRSICKECGGSQICPHQRLRSKCKGRQSAFRVSVCAK